MKLLDVLLVTDLVGVQFVGPELAAGARESVSPTAVKMPEAAMDEYYLLMPREDKIRGSRQVPPMESVSQTHGMRYCADSQFWFRVL